jgi:hypothetical protein
MASEDPDRSVLIGFLLIVRRDLSLTRRIVTELNRSVPRDTTGVSSKQPDL